MRQLCKHIFTQFRDALVSVFKDLLAASDSTHWAHFIPVTLHSTVKGNAANRRLPRVWHVIPVHTNCAWIWKFFLIPPPFLKLTPVWPSCFEICKIFEGFQLNEQGSVLISENWEIHSQINRPLQDSMFRTLSISQGGNCTL